MLDALAQNASIRIALLLAVFLLVAGFVYLLASFLSNRSILRERLSGLKSADAPGIIQTQSLREQQTGQGWKKIADTVERTGLSLVDTQSDVLRSKLIAAGYNSPAAPRIFTLIRLLFLFGLPLLYVVYAYAQSEPPTLFKLYLIGTILAVLGLYLPNLFIRAKADRRRQDMINGFPDCLDLMLVCVEAGLGLESAFDRVGRETIGSHPLLAKMLSIVTLELRAGVSREEALRGMANRTQIDEIRSFSTLLIQSDKLGSSIGTTLRVYANEMREKRRLRAEEKAHRLPVLLSIPLVVCMLPVMIGVLMLPAAIRIIREILPTMTG